MIRLAPKLPRHQVQRLVFGMLAGPSAWTAQLIIGYALTPLACGGPRWPLYFLSLVAALVTVVAGAMSIAGLANATPGPPDEPSLSRFLAFGGMIISLIFLLLIIFTSVPMFFLNACVIR